MNDLPCLAAALLSCASLFLFCGCAGTGRAGSEPAPDGAVRTITETDAAQPVELATGTTIHLALASNQTTGYRWEPKNGHSDDPVAIVGDSSYVRAPAPEGTVGSGGTQTFTLSAKKPGTITLEFIYARPFGDHEVAKRVSFKFVVR